MRKFFQNAPKFPSSSASTSGSISGSTSGSRPNEGDDSSVKRSRIEINLSNLQSDPGLRQRITSLHPNDIEQMRRAYWEKGPCQPRQHRFPYTRFGNTKKPRRFNPVWFSEYGSWLEYSIAKDAAYCLCCYLFKQDIGEQAGGDLFVTTGFTNWKNKDGLRTHVGGHGSSHNQALSKCLDLANQNQHIENVFAQQSNQSRIDYRVRLEASVDTTRILLKQGLAFRGNDESEESSNRGNYLEFLQWLADHREDIASVVLENAPANHKMTSPDIQKDIINSCASETIKVIINDIGGEFFSLLVDESSDVSKKEQMAVVLRYVNEKGDIIECFLGIEHVSNTSALSLKQAIDGLFSKNGLSIASLRGQGYDGASNMRGEFKGLKTLIMNENECAYYVHCFAHQLQLTLVAVAKNHHDITWFFNSVSTIVNVAGASCKRSDALREKKAKEVIEALSNGDITSGRGLNQESTLARPCDTRWGSHYATLSSLIYMYSAVIDVIQDIRDYGNDSKQVGEARGLLFLMDQFDFVFNLHLMKAVLAVTNELSQALQRKDQDIVNAMNLVVISKRRLQMMREDGWDSLLEEITLFCVKHDLHIPDMNDDYLVSGRSRRGEREISNLHHYQVQLFYTVLDMQLQELNTRFNEGNTELLLCMACLSPDNQFSAFDKKKLIRLASFYPKDFSELQRTVFLSDQLETYIHDVRFSDDFMGLSGLGKLANKMVQTRRNTVYPLVYRLLKLALVLPVATATVERVFSAMKIVKNRLRNRIGDQFLNDSLIVYIEKDISLSVSNESIMQNFQKMRNRRLQL